MLPTLSNSGSSFHIHQLNVATDGRRDEGFAHILQLLRAPATHRTIAHHVRVKMTAARAFDGVRW